VIEAPTVGQQYDAVVVGSGFGGSIAALRLAEAGKSVLVLERGRRYRPGEFPRDVTDVDRLLWDYPRRRQSLGLFDLQFFSGVGVVTASGVGGGSLIYAGIHIRPDAVVFDDPRWPRSIDRAVLEPYYERVAELLGIGPIPADVALPKRDAYRNAAATLGREVFDPDMAISWIEPGVQGREACRLVAECEFGCQHGAKNTVDLTYLAGAEELGATVVTGAHVSHVEPVGGGGYTVVYDHVPTGPGASVTGSRVILAAGTLGTNEILLRSRDLFGTLPALGPALGIGFSGNGDFLGSIQNSRVDLEPWRGPDVTSVIRYFDAAPEFTLAAPTFNREVMEVIASLGQARGTWLRPLAPLLWPRLGSVLRWSFRHGLLSRPVRFRGPNAGEPERLTNLFAIGRDSAGGVLRLRRNRLDVEWDYERENRPLVDRMQRAMGELAETYGGTFAPLVTWNAFRRITTVHPLGGCRLSESPHDGVVTPEGTVHGYPGLFVADGSVIPSSIGFHPVMTIAALAERTAEAVVSSFPA
jgi:cholesterol oxidase